MPSIGPQSKPRVSWSPIGPGGGGWLTAITVVDDAANTIYVGCDVGGVYKSTDHGESWEIKNAGFSIYYVEDIAYDPRTPSTLYAATRGGIYKSTDGGDHWVSKRSGFPPVDEYSFSAPISDILVDPNSPNILYAGVGIPRAGYGELEGYHWQTSGVRGAIYKSADFGENWTLIQGTGIDSTAMVYSLAIDPEDSNLLYAATSTGIYRSTSAGATWTPRNAGLPHRLAMGLAIDPSDSRILYTTLWAEPGSGTWQGGVYKSFDGGKSWVAKNSGLPHAMGPEEGLTSNYPTILIDPQNPQTLYVGHTPWWPDPGVYKSVDGGNHWTWVSRGEPPQQNVDMGWIDQHGLFVKCMAIDPNNTDRVYFGTSTHLFKTEDAGLAWDQVYTEPVGSGYWKGTGMETTCVQEIVVDPTDSNKIYAGYWDMGFLKSTDGGVSFKRMTQGMNYDSNTFSIIVDPVNPNVIWAATGWWESNEGEVCVSLDYGEHWTPLGDGLPDAQIWSIALDESSPPNSRTLYAASYGNGVYKSTNGGLNWSFAGNGLGLSGNKQVVKVVVDPNNPDLLYAGLRSRLIEIGGVLNTIQGGLFKSTDAGSSWSRIDRDSPQMSVLDIAIDPNDSRIIYSAVNGDYDHTRQVTYFGGVYKSTDGGVSWTNGSRGFGALDNLNVMSVKISPVDSRIIYAATSDDPFHDLSSGRGIFRSMNAGNSWAPINHGLGVLYFSVITIDPSNPSLLYAGSGGNGIMKGIVSVP